MLHGFEDIGLLPSEKVASKDYAKKGVEGGLLATMVDSAVIG